MTFQPTNWPQAIVSVAVIVSVAWIIVTLLGIWAIRKLKR